MSTPDPQREISVNGIAFSHEDIRKVVDDFYTRVSKDPLLSVPFSSVHDWPAHIARMTHFWWMRFGGRPYIETRYNPVEKHFFAGFNADYLRRWLSLFHETLAADLSDDQIKLWSLLTERMGRALSVKNELYRDEYESTHRRSGDPES
jgi:hemoglobin